MNCFDARPEIALLAGGDLTEASRKEELRRHLTHCRECRREYKSVKESLKVLTTAAAPPTWISTGSLWPQVEQRITPPKRLTGKTWRRLRRLRHWTPLAAMTAACVLMVVSVSRWGGHEDSSAAGRSMIGSQPPVAIRQNDDAPPNPEPMDELPVLPVEMM